MALCDALERLQQQRRSLQNALCQSSLQAIVAATSPDERQITWNRIFDNIRQLFHAPKDVGRAERCRQTRGTQRTHRCEQRSLGQAERLVVALSWGKCWFSETRNLYMHYDIEHFRPKKVAKELAAENHRDGYWWLAFDCMNFRVCGTVGNRKNGGWFPLRPGSLCSAYTHQCEESETPYLIDPVNDEDVASLAFDEEGKITPAPGISAWDLERVNETIKRLKLNEHEPLSEARRKVWQQVDCLIDDFKNAKTRCDPGSIPSAMEKIRQVCARVREMTQPTAELSSVARALQADWVVNG
jgi:hypothetical protein